MPSIEISSTSDSSTSASSVTAAGATSRISVWVVSGMQASNSAGGRSPANTTSTDRLFDRVGMPPPGCLARERSSCPPADTRSLGGCTGRGAREVPVYGGAQRRQRLQSSAHAIDAQLRDPDPFHHRRDDV